MAGALEIARIWRCLTGTLPPSIVIAHGAAFYFRLNQEAELIPIPFSRPMLLSVSHAPREVRDGD
jgi:hypothetical protein